MRDPGIRVPFQSPVLPAAGEIERYLQVSRGARWFSNFGPCYTMLAERLEAYVGGGVHCVPVASGTDGIVATLQALALLDRSHVVVPSFTFIATLTAVRRCGLKPVFCDVDGRSWHMDPPALRATLEALGDSVAAVIPVSAFGAAPPIELRDDLSSCCADAGVPMIVDSAAGFGARDEAGAPLGGQGLAEVFSFHATKPFGIGEGGAVMTSDPDVAERVRRLVNFDFDAKRVPQSDRGLNGKLSELHAATGLAVLDVFDAQLEARRTRAARVREHLSSLTLTFQAGCEGSSWQFVPALAPQRETRDSVLAHCAIAGVEARQYYEPLHSFEVFAGVPAPAGLEHTESIAARALSLPLASDMPAESIERVANAVRAGWRVPQEPPPADDEIAAVIPGNDQTAS
jgi:dTDP-4-amino-4,6-dideoxygalactose transaminase